MNKPFIPDDFKVPAVLETDRFRLRMLNVNDLEKDYDAVMSSLDLLQAMFAEGDCTWPRTNMTLKEDLADLVWHQSEFE